MGRSYTAVAGFVLDALAVRLRGTNPSSNTIDRINGFWELGREQADGAITGTIWKGVGKNEKGIEMIRRAGGFRIESDGTISRFPYASRYDRERAEMEGMRRFHETYGPNGHVTRYEHPRNTEYRYNFVVE